MINFEIDGKPVSSAEGRSILDVARENGIFIPALCHHKAVSPYGACRLCLVEVEKRGRKRVVASCSYPVEEGISVDTQAPAAVKARNMVMEMLLARCPGSARIRALAERMGVKATRFPKQQNDCILCGLCVRVCAERLGRCSIAFVGRGMDRQVVPPFAKQSPDCIGCGACAAVCPTDAIEIGDDGIVRIIADWNTVLRRARCAECGRYFAPVRQLEHVSKALPAGRDLLALCPDCRRKQTVRCMAAQVPS